MISISYNLTKVFIKYADKSYIDRGLDMKFLKVYLSCLWVVMVLFLVCSCGRDDSKSPAPSDQDKASNEAKDNPRDQASASPTPEPQAEAARPEAAAAVTTTPTEAPLMTWTNPNGQVWQKFLNAQKACVKPTPSLIRAAYAAGFQGFGNSVMWANDGNGEDYKYNGLTQSKVSSVNAAAINVCIK